ncbi:LamB/YcsF family protein [Vibrio sp. ZSDE26]|uniref:LamB/YcsF family protein n=1 Tax=Vibrio amylolyticus TaxID=2847292 RepID=A0A9X1XL41_9VIBR|nr:5-oxoprolinase subunit PxpA [Vibrio amylolyticus]MCK6263898.1 LamB/YcsF family protein [Vibrio amylolyticus]
MGQTTITLNCDMGESYGAWKMGSDEKVMPYINMANIACGFHASDPEIMSQTIDLALKHHVKIGAHPSYPDIAGFGRRSMVFEPQQLSNLLIYQIGAIKALCESKNSELKYVKPHGALYNDMQTDHRIFEAVIDAVSCFRVPLMTLASQQDDEKLEIADRFDVPLLFEAFIDRAYLANGLLAPRTIEGSVLTHRDDILSQLKQIVDYQRVTTLDGFIIPIEADTICVHGDNDDSIQLIQEISTFLKGKSNR